MKGSRLIFSAVILLAFACTTAEKTYTVEEVDGAKYIHYHEPAWGDDTKIRLEFVAKLGELEGDDENYQFFRPNDVAVDDDGNLYLLESGSCVIKKFNKDLRYVKTFAAKGQGPGELEFPVQIFIGPDNLLNVNSMSNGRLETFTLNGDYADTFRNIVLRNSRVISLSSGLFARVKWQHSMDEAKDPENSSLIEILDKGGKILNSFGKLLKYDDVSMALYGNGCVITNDVNDNIYSAFTMQDRIEKYSQEGSLLWSVTRDLPYAESQVMVTNNKLSYNNFSYNIVLDNEDRIWVETYERQLTDEEKQIKDPALKPNVVCWEIYNNDGILLTRIKPDLPAGYNLKLIHDSKAYFTNPSDYMDVRIFKITE